MAAVQSTADNTALEQSLLFTPVFNADGLIPAIATDRKTGMVLMFAWMTAEALAKTLETGDAHFYSRSRRKLWRKGEDSGNVLRVQEMRVDCDQDVLWLQVEITGPGVACHTGTKSCFYRRVRHATTGTVLERVKTRP